MLFYHLIFHFMTIFQILPMQSEFKTALKKALTEKDKSEYLKNIFLHLENNPDDSCSFWYYEEMKFLVLQLLISPFPELNGNEISKKKFQDVITILNILQIIVINPRIRKDFLSAQFPFFIYPYLNTNLLNKQFESLRIASLGVIGQLLRDNDKETLFYLQNTEMVPLTLKIMDIGSSVSKKIATLIFLRIIESNDGLEYACQTFERFVAISVILNSMTSQLLDNMDKSLFDYVLKCYIRLSHHKKVRMSFNAKKPEALFSKKMNKIIVEDNDIKASFESFLRAIKM